MLKLLGFDSSTESLSVAVCAEGSVYYRQVLAGQSHSVLLMPMINETLLEAGLTLTDLDGLCYGAGPGSFTGLRIACGVAQGLAFGADLPIAPVSTLLALAEAAQAEKVVAAIDARMGEVYLAAYERLRDQWTVHLAPGLFAPSSLPALSGKGWVAVGNGFDHYSLLEDTYGSQLDGHLPDRFPDAREIIVLGQQKLMCGEGVDAADAAPVYIRNKVALKMSERRKR
ncbi:MAG TPA: tRNA (adenosine(37)-N6)-threonylcarbamoyltransferase complex dimerization subunit type 1 TsaB [Burkholderiales bacterium]|nr:tRNA (adenosine(37)-N6)-threonylcarbamoyltransferase complex dimerization subunit type 1 TsaB [Burkholderiales bacterium]